MRVVKIFRMTSEKLLAASIAIAFLTFVSVALIWLSTPVRAYVKIPFNHIHEMEAIFSACGMEVTFPTVGNSGAVVGVFEDPISLRRSENALFRLVERKGLFCKIRYVPRWNYFSYSRSVGDPLSVNIE